MVPSTLATFAAFLMLVAPGLVFEIRRERRRPALEETTFREASRVALTSLLFSGASLAALSIVRAARPSLLPDLGLWLHQGNGFLVSRYRLVARAGLAEVALAIGIALGVDAWLARFRSKGHIAPYGLWYQVFRVDRLQGQWPWVSLRLADKTQVWGYLRHYDPGADVKSREIAVRGDVDGRHLYIQADNDDKVTELTDWQTIVVPGDQIVLMKVTYRDDVLHPHEGS